MPSPTAQEAYASLESAFITRNPKSHSIHAQATTSLPGGNTRSVLYYAPFPLSATSATGSHLISADGDTYIDLLGEYTAGLYGHSDPIITSSVQTALSKGLNFGSHHENELHLAQQVKQRFPSIDLLRFTNSGTEANLMALAAAKHHTSRPKILVFANGYHGGAFTFSSGISSPLNAPHEYLIATYNDIASVERLVPGNEESVAAIVVEPMLGSGGAIPAKLEFLRGLRKVATRIGAVLIFDEVMTSRMYGGGGVQSQLEEGERPDMTTLGKYIGGGMSFGAFGGSAAIMSMFDPRKPGALKHAGTFNNNVLTMAAGRAGLEQIFTPQRAEELHARGDKLRERLNEAGAGTFMKVTGLGSVMCFHFTKTPVAEIQSHHDIVDADAKLCDLLHLFLLEEGYYIARRGFIALSLALSAAELDGFVKVVEAFVARHRSLLEVGSTASKL